MDSGDILNAGIKSHLDSILRSRQTEDADFPDIAVGYSFFEAGRNTRDTINLADENMYKNKKEMRSL